MFKRKEKNSIESNRIIVDQILPQIQQINDEIKSIGEKNANTEEVVVLLKEHLATLNSKVKEDKKLSLSDIFESLKAFRNHLVDVIGSSQMNIVNLDKTGIKFVPVEAGAFLMEIPPSDKQRSYNETQRQEVTLKDFEIGSTEVTQLQWFVVMGSNPSYFKENSNCRKTHMKIEEVLLCPHLPVESVSWDNVKKYISEYNKRAQDNFTYRLPTEAEWEFAARAGTKTAYSFGNSSSKLTDYAWFSENSEWQTRAVATKKPNQLEIYDVYGNVWELVEDWYQNNENNHHTGSGSSRVMRGGSWLDAAHYSRSASRNEKTNLDDHWNTIGFRLVRVPKDSSKNNLGSPEET